MYEFTKMLSIDHEFVVFKVCSDCMTVQKFLQNTWPGYCVLFTELIDCLYWDDFISNKTHQSQVSWLIFKDRKPKIDPRYTGALLIKTGES